MRARDARAIAFCFLSSVLLLAGVQFLVQSWLITAPLVAAYDVWLLTRPRMMRLFRRVRGERIQAYSYLKED
jgi:hypothetical protein